MLLSAVRLSKAPPSPATSRRIHIQKSRAVFNTPNHSSIITVNFRRLLANGYHRDLDACNTKAAICVDVSLCFRSHTVFQVSDIAKGRDRCHAFMDSSCAYWSCKGQRWSFEFLRCSFVL